MYETHLVVQAKAPIQQLVPLQQQQHLQQQGGNDFDDGLTTAPSYTSLTSASVLWRPNHRRRVIIIVAVIDAAASSSSSTLLPPRRRRHRYRSYRGSCFLGVVALVAESELLL